MDDAIDERLRRYLVEELDLPATVTFEDDLVQKGFLASAQLIDVVVFVEDEFGIALRPIDILPENMRSIASIAAGVRGRIAEGRIGG
jgi:acyl carrier protein